MCDYQRSSGHVVTRRGSTGRLTVPYGCTIDVRTHTGPYGGPMGPPGPRRYPTGPRRTAGGTVGPRLIGASPVWVARNSYWRQPVLLYGLSVRAILLSIHLALAASMSLDRSKVCI